MKTNVKKQRTGISLISKLLTACIASAAIMTAAASPASAVELGHSGEKIKFTIENQENTEICIHYNQLGWETDVDLYVDVEGYSLPDGEYYFKAEQIFSSYISMLFEYVAKDNNFDVEDILLMELGFYTSDGDRVYPSANMNFVKYPQIKFNALYSYEGSCFDLLDFNLYGNSIGYSYNLPDTIVIAKIGNKYDYEYTSYDEEGGEMEYSICPPPIDDKGFAYESEVSDTEDNRADELSVPYENNGSKPGDNTTDSIKDIKKLTPDGKPTATGDATKAVAIVTVSCAAASAAVLLAVKSRKKKK